MEFQDVVRRRKMVRSYATTPSTGGRRPRRCGTRCARAERRVQPGLGVPRARHPGDVRRWEATAEDVDRPDEWLRGMMRAPVVIVPCSSKAAYLRRYAGDDKGWTDQDERRWLNRSGTWTPRWPAC